MSNYLRRQLLRSLARPEAGLPADSEAGRNLGVTCEIAGKELLKTAGALFDRAVALEPRAIDWVHIATIRSHIDHVRRALDDYERAAL